MKKEGFGDLRLLKTLDNFDKASEALIFYSEIANRKFVNKQKKFISISKKLFKEPYEIVFRCISSFFTKRPSETVAHSSSKNFTLGFTTNLLNLQASTFTVTLFFAIVCHVQSR